MPVTQILREQRPLSPDNHGRSVKHMKQPLRLTPAEHRASAPVDKPHGPPHPEMRRRLRRLVHGCRYHYPDAYAEHFLCSRAQSERVPRLQSMYLRPGAKFIGEQQSGAARYDIKVELKTVDLVSSVVTGFFQISGLTEEHPLITTCFKGEIINNPLSKLQWGNSGRDAVHVKKYSFITEEDNWALFPKNDMEHWKKLTGQLSHTSEHALALRLLQIQHGADDNQYIYMRWKEEFLLPDLRVKLLKGASFEGFYYIVLNIGGGARSSTFTSDIIPGTISGLYFHTQSEKFQLLLLRYVEERGSANTFEFV